MDSLTIIPYKYVATKPRKSHHPRSSKKSGSRYSELRQRRSDMSMLRGELPQLSTGEEHDESPELSRISCSVAPQVTGLDDNHSDTAREPAISRKSHVEPIVATSCETVRNCDSANYATTRKYSGLSEAQPTGHFVPGVDNSDNNIDSLFGDISYLFDEDFTIEINKSEASRHGEGPSHNCELSPRAEEEYHKDDVYSVSSQGGKRQASSAQKRDQILHTTSRDSVKGETSDQTDNESVFDDRLHKKRKYSSPLSSRDNSVLFTDDLTQCSHLDNDIFDRQGTIVGRGHNDNPIVIGDFGDEYTSNEPEIDNSDFDKGSDDELCHSPSRYRFGPVSARQRGDSVARGYARTSYAAKVLDVSRERGLDGIYGMEYIDGVKHYLVGWTQTLVRSDVLERDHCSTWTWRFQIARSYTCIVDSYLQLCIYIIR